MPLIHPRTVVQIMIHILTQAYHCPPYCTPQEPLCCRPHHENNCTIINPTAPYKLHPVTTASTGEGREMAKLLDLSTGAHNGTCQHRWAAQAAPQAN